MEGSKRGHGIQVGMEERREGEGHERIHREGRKGKEGSKQGVI